MIDHTAPAAKNAREHLQFLNDLALLKIHWAFRQALQPAQTGDLPAPITAGSVAARFRYLLEHHTFLLNLTAHHDSTLYDLPRLKAGHEQAWQQLLDQLQTAAARLESSNLQAAVSLAERMEVLASECFGGIPDLFASRVDADLAELHDPVHGLAARPSCLWFRKPHEGDCLEFHIANDRYPSSFLKDLSHTRSCIVSMALEAREMGLARVSTTTWMNELPAWLELFPDGWRQGLGSRLPVGPHLGSWGQVITARQTLSSHGARQVRAQGALPLAMRQASVSIDELLQDSRQRGEQPESMRRASARVPDLPVSGVQS